jgi:hypothetical protein
MGSDRQPEQADPSCGAGVDHELRNAREAPDVDGVADDAYGAGAHRGILFLKQIS